MYYFIINNHNRKKKRNSNSHWYEGDYYNLLTCTFMLKEWQKKKNVDQKSG